MSESIEKINLNFSNAGGGHTASVETVLNAKNLDGSEGLGTVVGDLGEINSFSNDKISEMMTNFICTQHSIGADPVKKVISRKYIDKTSLRLKSFMVLVRGINCGPEELNFEGVVPYFTEVINSPLRAFKSQGPKIDSSGSVIMLGRIYNYESAAQFDGSKITLVYQNRKLKKKLSLNDERVSETYKANPDLSQYDLKFGYTTKEFKEALAMVGIFVSGMPDDEDILFENTGTLDSILGTIAAFYGYFWFVDPTNGSIRFVNTEMAAGINIKSYTGTTDENITAASFTKSKNTGRLVNAYIGSAEKPERKAPKDDARPRKSVFKRVIIEDVGGDGNIAAFPLSSQTLGIFYFLFNQNAADADLFNKYTLFLVYAMTKFAGNRSLLQKRLGNDRAGKIDLAGLYTDKPFGNVDATGKDKLIKYGPSPRVDEGGFAPIDDDDLFIFPATKTAEANKISELEFRDIKLDRIRDKFEYIKLRSQADETKDMVMPSTSELYGFLKAFFEFSGGLFISNGYSQYKAERMDFENTNTMTVVGPFHERELLSEIDELSDVQDFFKMMKVPFLRIRDLAAATSSARQVNPFHFVGIRAEKSRERKKDDEAVDFRYLQNLTELLVFNQVHGLVLGGPTRTGKAMRIPFNGKNLTSALVSYAKQSLTNWNNATKKTKKTMRLSYTRAKTRVNPLGEEGEEAEDDAIADSSADDQKVSDLFDRFDIKFFDVQAPSYSMLNNLTMFSASGNVSEMKALKTQRGNYANSADIPKSSSRTLYGLHIPKFNPTINSLSISVGPQGITTTINESTIKLIPPDQEMLTDRGLDTSVRKSNISNIFTASQRNTLGL